MSRIEVDQQPTQKDRELAWKQKRATRITSSNIAKLMTPGRGKGETFGKTAIDYIDDLVFQIRENDLIDQVDAWQMQFGRDNEPLAFEWLRDNFMEEYKCGATDFGDDILFLCPSIAFGDSPDGIAYVDDEPHAWVEVKNPANKKKACNLTLNSVKVEDVVDEYRWQFIGHFLGSCNLDYGHYIIYNSHINELTGKPYNRGRRFILHRKDFEPSISITEKKIEKIYEFILLCVKGDFKPEQVNEWWAITQPI
jgi:hypothetical protein